MLVHWVAGQSRVDKQQVGHGGGVMEIRPLTVCEGDIRVGDAGMYARWGKMTTYMYMVPCRCDTSRPML